MDVKVQKLVVKARVLVVALDKLSVDPSYQRDIKRKHKDIVADFNETALGIPLVGQREDSSLWIVDGQQRITALKKLNWKEVKAEVFASNGPEHEAEIFKLINLNRTKLNAQEEFRALLTAGDPVAWEIKEAVEGCGFKLSLNMRGGRNLSRMGLDAPAKMKIACLSTLRNIAKNQKMDAIKFVLNVIKTCWPGDPQGVVNNLVLGMARMYVALERVPDMERLVPRFSSVTPHKILYAANSEAMGGEKSHAVCMCLLKLYNKRVNSRRGS